jgi:hypothetical protein
MLLFVDKAHHVFDACAVVPTAIDAARELSAADAEKKALIEKFSRPSGVSDEERLARAAAIIKRAANNGLTEVEVVRFPNELCTDRGRAINQREPGWEKTLTGYPKELYDFWGKHLKARGYKVGFQIVDFPGGDPATLGLRCGGTESLGYSIAWRCWSASPQKASLTMFPPSSIVAWTKDD